MAKVDPVPLPVRQFLQDAARAEARARSASPSHAAQLLDEARNLRAAAARIAARHREKQGGELDL